MKKLDKQSFATKVASLSQAISVQGKVYHSIRVSDEAVKFIRGRKAREENINLTELYDLYLEVPNPTNQEARKYISGRVQSPAVSIINALGNADNHFSANAVPQKVTESTRSSKSTSVQATKVEKDEMKFFSALNEMLGSKWLRSKSIHKPISSSDVFLSDNFQNYAFPESIEKNFEVILTTLRSNFSSSSKSLSHFIDGLLIDHPVLGSRIVEFDEEQHFTPALRDAISVQSQEIKNPFNEEYMGISGNLEFLNDSVLSKHRLKNRLKETPVNWQDFTAWLAQVHEKPSGYIEPKENGFPYLGGRIAQRAYYDCLRNAAHLSPKNPSLQAPLRFPKKYFEDASGKRFGAIAKEQVMELIAEYLEKVYGFIL